MSSFAKLAPVDWAKTFTRCPRKPQPKIIEIYKQVHLYHGLLCKTQLVEITIAYSEPEKLNLWHICAAAVTNEQFHEYWGRSPRQRRFSLRMVIANAKFHTLRTTQAKCAKWLYVYNLTIERVPTRIIETRSKTRTRRAPGVRAARCHGSCWLLAKLHAQRLID